EQREVDDPEKAVLALRHPAEALTELQADAREHRRRDRLRLGEQQEQVARLELAGFRQPRALAVGEELRGGRLPAVRPDPDPGEPACALGGGEADEVVELAARERGAAAPDGEAADRVTRGERVGKDPEPGSGEARREVDELEVDAELRTVAAVALHSLALGQARERAR